MESDDKYMNEYIYSISTCNTEVSMSTSLLIRSDTALTT